MVGLIVESLFDKDVLNYDTNASFFGFTSILNLSFVLCPKIYEIFVFRDL